MYRARLENINAIVRYTILLQNVSLRSYEILSRDRMHMQFCEFVSLDP